MELLSGKKGLFACDIITGCDISICTDIGTGVIIFPLVNGGNWFNGNVVSAGNVAGKWDVVNCGRGEMFGGCGEILNGICGCGLGVPCV